MKITITRKNGNKGNLFIGEPNAKGQVVVATFTNPTQAAKWYQDYKGEWHGQYSSYGQTIKATYSQSQTYYDLSTLRSKAFWQDIFGVSKKAKAAKAKAEAEKAAKIEAANKRESQRNEALQALKANSPTFLKDWKKAGAQHPAPENVLLEKQKSGLTWRDFIETI